MVECLGDAVRLAEQVRLVLVEWPARPGLPRMACARRLLGAPDDLVALGDWYARRSAGMLFGSAEVTIVVWDADSGAGYQLVGHTEAAVPLCNLSPEADLYVRVNKVVAFGADGGWQRCAASACC